MTASAAAQRAPVIVFLGPTLPRAEAERELPAIYLGPVSQGDVLRATAHRPAAIAIIDGYFARVPAVWHKEILWALAQGIRVLGASSMGALRAAELHAFGMEGVGEIAAAFAAGELEDDDEVTIVHGGEDSGYRPLSDALVDLRATLARAVAEGALDGARGAELIAALKAMHYPDRSYAAALRVAAARWGGEASESLRRWVADHRVTQKRADALLLLQVLRRRWRAGELDRPPPPVRFRLEHTDAWDQLVRGSGHGREPSHLDPRITEPLLDELRLAPAGVQRAAMEGALARALAADLAARDELCVDAALLSEAANQFFLDRGQLSPQAIQAWMAAEQLDESALARFLEREARVHWARTRSGADVLDQLPDALRASGALGPLLRRAVAKHALRAALGEDALVVDDAAASALLHWYFTTRRGSAPPGDASVCARVLGFASADALLRALALEQRYGAASEVP